MANLINTVVNAGSVDASDDASLYIVASNNNDWGLRINKYNNSATEYGMRIEVGSSAGYAMQILGNGSESLRIYGSGAITTQSTIDVNSGLYLRNSLYVLNAAGNGWQETIVRNSGSPYFANNVSGGTFLASNGSENNNWLFQENARGWGIYYFNNGTQGGQTIGTYSTVGAETFFIGQYAGITMPSAWTGYNASSKIAAMISNYDGYIYSASTVFAATSLRSPIFYDSDNANYYLDPASTSNLNGLTVAGTITGSITGNAGTVTNGLYTNTNQNITGIKTVYVTSNTLVNTVTTENKSITIFQDTANADAYMTFHIGGDYAGYFGLGGAENDLVWGGWSVGNNRHRILHSGNQSYAWNLNQNLRTSDSPSFVRLTSTQSTGTSPFTVSSTTVVSNLNSDLLDGQHGSYYQNPDNLALSTSWRTAIINEASIGPFLYGTYADILAFRTISNLQYWDGSAWQTYTNANIQAILTGNIQGTTATVLTTNRKFRFEFTAVASYVGGGVLVVHQLWNNGAHQLSTMLEYYDGSSWVVVIPERTSAGGESDYHFYNRANIHGSWTQYRITITGVDTVNNASYNGIQLLADYPRAGFPNNFLPITWDYLKNVTTTGSFRAPIFYDSDNTNYYLDPASTSVLNNLTAGVIKGDSGADYPHSFTNTDSGNTHWVNRNNRLLTSNGTNWATDGRDPIMALVTSGNSNATTIANSIGLVLHNESQTNNTFSPAIVFSNRSNSGSYNTAYAAIIGKKTGQGYDSNWSAGELHFYTMPVGAYENDVPSLLINSSGDVTAARYLVGTYVNTTDDVSSSNISYIMAKFGDNYYRSATAAKVAGFISGQNMNIVGSSTSCTGNAATATTATNSTQLGGVAAANYVRNDVDGTDSTDLFRLKTFTKSLTVTTTWLDTGISSTDLATGVYLLSLYVDNYSVSGGHYTETYAGTMSWFSSATNSAEYDEIPLHKSGHAPNARYISLRTLRGISGVLKLQIICNITTSGASNYVFKFRRMI